MAWQGNSMGAAWERHGMGELALSLSRGRFPSGFPTENLRATCRAHLIDFDCINRVLLHEDRKLLNYRLVRKKGDVILILSVGT
jgi:hypothetical protein